MINELDPLVSKQTERVIREILNNGRDIDSIDPSLKDQVVSFFNQYGFDDVETIRHTEFYTHQETVDHLRKWLELEDPELDEELILREGRRIEYLDHITVGNTTYHYHNDKVRGTRPRVSINPLVGDAIKALLENRCNPDSIEPNLMEDVMSFLDKYGFDLGAIKTTRIYTSSEIIPVMRAKFIAHRSRCRLGYSGDESEEELFRWSTSICGMKTIYVDEARYYYY